MSELFYGFLQRKRLISALVLLVTIAGIASWMTMPRQEDPSFVKRWSLLLVPFPGADVQQVERLVIDPIEDELAESTVIVPVESTARPGVAMLTIRLKDTIYDVDAAWTEVSDALDRAELELPDGVLELDWRKDIGDPESVVLMITGDGDPLNLREAAHTVTERLQRVKGVSRVQDVADPGARISVLLDPAVAHRLGIDARLLSQQLAARNVTVPGGSIAVDGRQVLLRPNGEFRDVEAVAATPIVLPSGAAVPLSELAEVRLEPLLPVQEKIHHRGRVAVGLAVVPTLPQDLVSFGERISAEIELARADVAPLQIEVLANQPVQVEARLDGLSRSLLLGVLIVALVLMLSMGTRMGAVVTAVVPLVTFATVAVYAGGGGVLHQISIAALVLSLGLLVDNAIVMAEAVQQHLDAGSSPSQAATKAIGELAIPLGTATGTTLAAFTPLLLAPGGTADFTRSIPLVLMTSLVISYAYALAVTPAMAAWLLRPATVKPEVGRFTKLVASLSRDRPMLTLAGVGVVLVLTAILSTQVEQQFFPLSDRPQFLVSVVLPEGSHLDQTERLASIVEDEVSDLEGVTGVTTFIGRGAPRFYYNLQSDLNSTHIATLVVDAENVEAVSGAVEEARKLARNHPEALIVPKRLQQGPPVGEPVEVKLVGDDLKQLHDAATAVAWILRETPGALDVRHDMGVGVPTLSYQIDDAWTTRHQLGRTDVALAMLSQTRGLTAGTWRGSWDAVDIIVGTPAGEFTAPGALALTDIATPHGNVPLAQLANATVQWAPAAIRHEDRRRQVKVVAQLAEGATFGGVRTAANPAIADLDLPGVEFSWGGEAEGSEEANGAMMQKLPIGAGLLLFFLLLEFDSVRRVGIVLVTVPLAAVGVIPGLALTGQPFGFMSMLGVIALVGIVVNNAIVLLNVVEQERKDGASVEDALQTAVHRRLRPILLTTATTVSGMLPLALAATSLWPPLAWAMISGLIASTGLTLIAVPALYRVLFDWKGPTLRRWIPATALLAFAGPAAAGTMTLDAVLLAAENAPSAMAAHHEARAARHDASATWMAAVGPGVGMSATYTQRDGAVEIETPFGPLPQLAEEQTEAGAEAEIPLFDPGALALGPAATRASQAASLRHQDAVRRARLQAGESFLDVVALQARAESLTALEASLESLASRVRNQVDAGLAVEADALRAEVALADARQGLLEVEAAAEVASWRLGMSLGLDQAIEPAFEAEQSEADDVQTSLDRSRLQRPDLLAVDRSVLALKSQKAAIWADMLPAVSAYGGVNWSDNESLVDDTWLEGGIRLRWTPIARGTRPFRAAAAGSRVAELKSRRNQLALGVGLEVRQAHAMARTATTSVQVRTDSLAQAQEARRILEDRYDQGMSTLTDVLQVEADVGDQRTALRLAEVEVVRARLRLSAAAGDPAVQ